MNLNLSLKKCNLAELEMRYQAIEAERSTQSNGTGIQRWQPGDILEYRPDEDEESR